MSERAIAQARAQLDDIVRIVDIEDEFERQIEIECRPLSLRVRNDWYRVGADPAPPIQYELLLRTGEPAVRIRGNLINAEPVSAHLEYQDWGRRWKRYTHITTKEQEKLMTFVHSLYYARSFTLLW